MFLVAELFRRAKGQGIEIENGIPGFQGFLRYSGKSGCAALSLQANAGRLPAIIHWETDYSAMKWSDAWSTGVPVLDAQHQALFECVDEIAEAAATGRLLLTIHAIDQLKTYVRVHFAAEEHLMRIHAYPRLDQHIAEHRAFAAKLFQLMMANTRADNSAEMIEFLTGWLVDHVSRSDMEYAPYMPW